MQRKVKITCDSTCDLSPELIKKYNISVSPLFITMDNKSYKDGLEVTPDDLYEYYNRTGKLAKSAAVNIVDYLDFFKANSDENTDIIHFCISSSMSTTYHNACLAAEELQNIYIFDTANLSTGSALLALKAIDMAEQGMEAKKIIEELNTLRTRVDASFVIDSLLYLYKGGRCSAVAALGANVLKLKPCIEVKNGAMGVGKKYRGKFEAVLETYVADRLDNIEDIDMRRMFVTHAGCDMALVNRIAEIVKESMPFQEVIVTRAGCTVSAHCGRNTLGVLFIRKSDLK